MARIRQSVAYGMGEVAQTMNKAEQLMKDFQKYGLRHRKDEEDESH